MIIDLLAQQDDTILEQTGINIVGALGAARGLYDCGDNHLCLLWANALSRFKRVRRGRPLPEPRRLFRHRKDAPGPDGPGASFSDILPLKISADKPPAAARRIHAFA